MECAATLKRLTKMKVGDLVRKKVSSNARVPRACFGIVVQVHLRADGAPWAKVDFGDYGVFWQRQSLLQLLS